MPRPANTALTVLPELNVAQADFSIAVLAKLNNIEAKNNLLDDWNDYHEELGATRGTPLENPGGIIRQGTNLTDAISVLDKPAFYDGDPEFTIETTPLVSTAFTDASYSSERQFRIVGTIVLPPIAGASDGGAQGSFTIDHVGTFARRVSSSQFNSNQFISLLPTPGQTDFERFEGTYTIAIDLLYTPISPTSFSIVGTVRGEAIRFSSYTVNWDINATVDGTPNISTSLSGVFTLRPAVLQLVQQGTTRAALPIGFQQF